MFIQADTDILKEHVVAIFLTDRLGSTAKMEVA